MSSALSVEWMVVEGRWLGVGPAEGYTGQAVDAACSMAEAAACCTQLIGSLGHAGWASCTHMLRLCRARALLD